MAVNTKDKMSSTKIEPGLWRSLYQPTWSTDPVYAERVHDSAIKKAKKIYRLAGEKWLLGDLCKVFNIKRTTLISRLKRKPPMSLEKAVLNPVNVNRKRVLK